MQQIFRKEWNHIEKGTLDLLELLKSAVSLHVLH